jgi:hypothetical protein
MLRQIIIPIGPSIAYVPLTQEQFACIDVDDIPIVDGRNWFADKDTTTGKFYAKRQVSGRKKLRMHQSILGKIDGYTPDHIDCSRTLDNRRANLRHATPSQQACNRRIDARSTSGYKGVTFNKQSGRWKAQIGIQGKRFFLGLFDTPIEASKAYEDAAGTHHGEFSRSS